MALVNSCPAVFVKNPSELGCTNILEMYIVELPNSHCLCTALHHQTDEQLQTFYKSGEEQALLTSLLLSMLPLYYF